MCESPTRTPGARGGVRPNRTRGTQLGPDIRTEERPEGGERGQGARWAASLIGAVTGRFQSQADRKPPGSTGGNHTAKRLGKDDSRGTAKEITAAENANPRKEGRGARTRRFPGFPRGGSREDANRANGAAPFGTDWLRASGEPAEAGRPLTGGRGLPGTGGSDPIPDAVEERNPFPKEGPFLGVGGAPPPSARTVPVLA